MVRDLTGQRFGRLTVLFRADVISRKAYWKCKCDCGTMKNIRGDCLVSGRVVSCGCYHDEIKTTHGDSKTRLYGIWHNMISRCRTPTNSLFSNYGGRGITVCSEWLNYDSFRKWAMENGYDMFAKRGECTIDRIDNNKGYSPDNCRWANGITQSRNKRNNRIIEYNGESHTLVEWAEIIGMNPNTLHARLTYLGWSVPMALTTPTHSEFNSRR